jgi:1-carboxybiuret hydrolase
MNASDLLSGPAHVVAAAVRDGMVSATAMVQASLARIAATDGCVNAFTDVLAERALQRAAAVDSEHRNGPALPLAGVPFAVKNLFDVRGLRTRAGSKIECDAAPASADAVLVARLEAAGAVLVGALNMDEYAYGFTTENSHVGPVRNPHDPTRIAGGSSGGSAAAVAAAQVPLTLGSDTNGSIRVPASLCGVFGLKPTFGRLPRTGSYPFVSSLDHLGPMARDPLDLALAYDAMQGHDAGDASCSRRPPEAVAGRLAQPLSGLRVGLLSGWFQRWATPQALAAVAQVAAALDARQTVELPMAEVGRAAAFLISNAEGGALHLDDLRRRAQDFEPLSRDRFLAGALLPAAWVARAQRVRRLYAQAAAEVFQRFDVLLAPATPCSATPLGQEWLTLDGQQLPLRASMGLLTQPISCIGLPVCAVPVVGTGDSLPLGVQIIAAPWREDCVLRVAAHLAALGVARAPVSTHTLSL